MKQAANDDGPTSATSTNKCGVAPVRCKCWGTQKNARTIPSLLSPQSCARHLCNSAPEDFFLCLSRAKRMQSRQFVISLRDNTGNTRVGPPITHIQTNMYLGHDSPKSLTLQSRMLDTFTMADTWRWARRDHSQTWPDGTCRHKEPSHKVSRTSRI